MRALASERDTKSRRSRARRDLCGDEYTGGKRARKSARSKAAASPECVDVIQSEIQKYFYNKIKPKGPAERCGERSEARGSRKVKRRNGERRASDRRRLRKKALA